MDLKKSLRNTVMTLLLPLTFACSSYIPKDFSHIENLVNSAQTIEQISEMKNNAWVSQKSNIVFLEEDHRFDSPKYLRTKGMPLEENVLQWLRISKDIQVPSARLSYEFSEKENPSSEIKVGSVKGMFTYDISQMRDMDRMIVKFEVDMENKTMTSSMDTFKYREERFEENIELKINELGVTKSEIFFFPDEDSESSKRMLRDNLEEDLQRISTMIANERLPENFYFVSMGSNIKNIEKFEKFENLPQALFAESVALVQKTNNEEKIISFFYTKNSPEGFRDWLKGGKNWGKDIARWFDPPKANEKEFHNWFEWDDKEKYQELTQDFAQDSKQLKESYLDGVKNSRELNPVEITSWIKENREKILREVPKIEPKSFLERLLSSDSDRNYLQKVVNGKFYDCLSPKKDEEVYYGMALGNSNGLIQPIRIGEGTYFLFGRQDTTRRLSRVLRRDNTNSVTSKVRFVPFEEIDGEKQNMASYKSYLFPDSEGIILSVYDKQTDSWVSALEGSKMDSFDTRNYLSLAASGIKWLFNLGKKGVSAIR